MKNTKNVIFNVLFVVYLILSAIGGAKLALDADLPLEIVGLCVFAIVVAALFFWGKYVWLDNVFQALSERDEACFERNKARDERDLARVEKDKARDERDLARAERDLARAERDSVIIDLYRANSEIDRLRSERRKAFEEKVKILDNPLKVLGVGDAFEELIKLKDKKAFDHIFQPNGRTRQTT